MPSLYTLRHYVDIEGVDPFAKWFDGLSDYKAQARIAARLLRLEHGLFGDCKPVGEGVWEIKVDAGPGYRIYYAIDDGDAVLLFQGGNKQTQKEDIKMAIRRWQDWKQRRKNEKR